MNQQARLRSLPFTLPDSGGDLAGVIFRDRRPGARSPGRVLIDLGVGD
jgi:hypothetical protein